MVQKAFIFDVDGVIIDSEPLHARAKLLALQSLGIKATAEELNLEGYVGRGADAFAKDMVVRYPQLSHMSWEEIADLKKKFYLELLANDPAIQPISGLRELLARLKAKNYRIGIGSSSRKNMVEMVLEKFQIRDYFASITAGDEVPRTKPDPAIYLLAAQRLGVEPVNCTVLEDAKSGVQAAKTAGMHCIAYRNPNSGNQDLSKADQIVDHYDEITV